MSHSVTPTIAVTTDVVLLCMQHETCIRDRNKLPPSVIHSVTHAATPSVLPFWGCATAHSPSPHPTKHRGWRGSRWTNAPHSHSTTPTSSSRRAPTSHRPSWSAHSCSNSSIPRFTCVIFMRAIKPSRNNRSTTPNSLSGYYMRRSHSPPHPNHTCTRTPPTHIQRSFLCRGRYGVADTQEPSCTTLQLLGRDR